MVKVCIVLENHFGAAVGGAEYQAHLLAEELSRRPDVSVTYLTRRPPDSESARKFPYPIRAVGSTDGVRRMAVFYDAPHLWRTLWELRPDVIYQRMRQSYTAVCSHYGRRAKIPIFFHVASDNDLSYRRFPGRSWASLPFDAAEIASGNWGIRRASHVIVQTARQQELLRVRFGKEACAVVPNFQPLPQSLPAKPEGRVTVLWISNIQAVKRPEMFLKLASAFTGRPDLQFMMIGHPSKRRSSRPLMQAIHEHTNVSYLGGLPIAEVNRHLESADIFVNTSSFEGFPNTFIQAWARGAVVASVEVDIDGGMDTLGVGYCTHGFENLCTVIDRLAKSRTERQTVAQRAFEHVHRRHSLGNAALLADLMLRAGGAMKKQCR